jgi:hypothetical protein
VSWYCQALLARVLGWPGCWWFTLFNMHAFDFFYFASALCFVICSIKDFNIGILEYVDQKLLLCQK